MKYNDQQIRFSSAFAGIRTCCSISCSCGREHFVASDGHGDYEDGELESLIEKSNSDPDKYVAEWQYDHIDAAFIEGRQIVVDCPCKGYKRYCDWIEAWADELTAYLIDFQQSKLATARMEVEQAEVCLKGLSQGTNSCK